MSSHQAELAQAPGASVAGGAIDKTAKNITSDTEKSDKGMFDEMRGWLMVLATLAASVTYQAGLNPPGGFWQDNDYDKYLNRSHEAGNPVLHDMIRKRYLTFYYFNATAFVMSLVIIFLLMNERFYKSEVKVVTLILVTMLDLMSLVGAYIAGSTRDMPSSIYIIALTCVAFTCVVYMAEIMHNVCSFVLVRAPCLMNWLPVTKGMKDKVLKNLEEKNERKSSKRKMRSVNKSCCCCSCGSSMPDEESR